MDNYEHNMLWRNDLVLVDSFSQVVSTCARTNRGFTRVNRSRWLTPEAKRGSPVNHRSNPLALVVSRISRVEKWRGGLGRAYLVAGSFVCRCLTSPTVLRFHFPLIEPDLRISRIRLSDQKSRFRPRDVARPSREPHQTEFPVQIVIGVQVVPQPAVFVLATQPLA